MVLVGGDLGGGVLVRIRVNAKVRIKGKAMVVRSLKGRILVNLGEKVRVKGKVRMKVVG